MKKISLLLLFSFVLTAAYSKDVKRFTTIDILDNYWKTYCATYGPDGPAEKPLSAGTYTVENMRQMIDDMAELGFERVYWITNYGDMLYGQVAALDNGKKVHGTELLKILVDQAHKRNMELYVIYKPFETGGGTHPDELPRPKELFYVKNTDGWQGALEFTVKNPHTRLRRRMPPRPANDKVHTITLVSRAGIPITLQREDFQLFASSENGRYREITDFTVEAGVTEKYPKLQKITFTPANLNDNDKFFIIKCSKKNNPVQIVHDTFSIVELRNSDGVILPESIATGRITLKGLNDSWPHQLFKVSNKDTRTPEEWILKGDFGSTLEKGAFTYDCTSSTSSHYVDSDGYIAFSACPIEYLGSLHPAYPEVMELWKEMVRRISASGCDGIDIRFGDHASWTIYGEEYGFNAPVVAEYKKRYGVDPEKEPYDRALWRQLNGEYLTEFMKWCSKTLHPKGQKLHAHISITMADRDFWRRNDAPANFKYEWKKWMQEKIIDGVNMKYLPFPWDGRDSSGLQYAYAIIKFAQKYQIETNIEARTIWWVEPTDSTSPPFTDAQYNRFLKNFRILHASGVDALNYYEVSDFFKIDGFGNPKYADKFLKLMNDVEAE